MYYSPGFHSRSSQVLLKKYCILLANTVGSSIRTYQNTTPCLSALLAEQDLWALRLQRSRRAEGHEIYVVEVAWTATVTSTAQTVCRANEETAGDSHLEVDLLCSSPVSPGSASTPTDSNLDLKLPLAGKPSNSELKQHWATAGEKNGTNRGTHWCLHTDGKKSAEVGPRKGSKEARFCFQLSFPVHLRPLQMTTLTKMKWSSWSSPVLLRKEGKGGSHLKRITVPDKRYYSKSPVPGSHILRRQQWKKKQFLDLSNITVIYFTAHSSTSKRNVLIFSCCSSA